MSLKLPPFDGFSFPTQSVCVDVGLFRVETKDMSKPPVEDLARLKLAAIASDCKGLKVGELIPPNSDGQGQVIAVATAHSTSYESSEFHVGHKAFGQLRRIDPGDLFAEG